MEKLFVELNFSVNLNEFMPFKGIELFMNDLMELWAKFSQNNFFKFGCF